MPVKSQFLIPVLRNLCSEEVVIQILWFQLRTPILADGVQLLLGSNTYLFFKSHIVNFAWETNVGRQETFCWFLFFGGALIVDGWGWGRKSHLGPAEIAFFCYCFFRKLVALNPEAIAKYLAIQLLLATSWLLATRSSPIYQVDEFIRLLPVSLKEVRTLWIQGSIFFVSGVNQGNAEVGWVQDFLV